MPAQWVNVPLKLDFDIAQTHGSGVSLLSGIYTSTAASLTALAASHPFMSNFVPRSRLINMVYSEGANGGTLQSFPPLVATTSVMDRDATVTNPRGIFWSEATSNLIEVWDRSIVVDGDVTATQFADDYTSGPAGFTDGLSSAGTAYVFVTTVQDAISLASNGAITAISDGDYPDPAIPTPVFLDSYVFVAKGGTRSIYNSAVGDQTSWAASTFINTEESAGLIVGLARHHKYLVALCEDHIEFFQDAAIPAPNSPLQRVTELTVQIGCVNRATICQYGDVVYFAGRAKGSQRASIYKIEGNKVTKVSTPSIDNVCAANLGAGYVQGYITSWGYATDTNAPGTNYTTMYVTQLRGKPLLVLCIKAGIAWDATSSSFGFPTFVYDIESQLWSELMIPHQTAGDYVYAGLPMPFGTVYENGSAAPISVFISAVKSNNDHYYVFDTSGIQLGYYDNDKSTFNGLAGGWYGFQTPVHDWGNPARKFVQGIYLGATRMSIESATDFPYSVTFYQPADIEAISTDRASRFFNPASVSNANRMVAFMGGAHHDFGTLLRFTSVSQNSVVYGFKLKIEAGVL